MKVNDIKFDERGLVPTIVQDAKTREVLMLAYMNAESLRRTLEKRETWFWSRSRWELWHKGATSGNVQRVEGVKVDCDADALLIEVEPAGAACHTGARSCFFREMKKMNEDERQVEDVKLATNENSEPVLNDETNLSATLEKLYALIAQRRAERPENSYTTYLFNAGLDKILKKIGEESAETIIAAKNADAKAFVAEVSDLIYHLIVLMVERGASLEDVRAELAERSMKGTREK